MMKMAIGTEYTVTAEKKRYRLEINNLERFCFNGGVEEEEIGLVEKVLIAYQLKI